MRVCNREGCGKKIVSKEGLPDYRRHFCSSDCLRLDKRERVRARRVRLKNGSCPYCGRKAVQDASLNGLVKLHNGAGSTAESELK